LLVAASTSTRPSVGDHPPLLPLRGV
jgi:hypothetical protein